MEHPEVRLNSAQLRVLAHPLRSRLLSALRRDGPATATHLAENLRTNTGATSYHLRQLAAVGMVVEEDQPGSGRQRWWRAAHTSHGWTDSEVGDDPDDRAAAEWLDGHYLRTNTERISTWLAERRDWSQEWRDAAMYGDYKLNLNAARLTALYDELEEVISRYVQTPAQDGSEDVTLVLYTFPERRGARRAAR